MIRSAEVSTRPRVQRWAYYPRCWARDCLTGRCAVDSRKKAVKP